MLQVSGGVDGSFQQVEEDMATLYLVKVCFYIVQYPVCWTTQSALHWLFLPDTSVHSDTNSTSLGSIMPRGNYAQRLFTHISTTVYSQVLIYTAEWTEASWRERKCPNFETVAKGGFEPELSWWRVQHSTTELPRSISDDTSLLGIDPQDTLDHLKWT